MPGEAETPLRPLRTMFALPLWVYALLLAALAPWAARALQAALERRRRRRTLEFLRDAGLDAERWKERRNKP